MLAAAAHTHHLLLVMLRIHLLLAMHHLLIHAVLALTGACLVGLALSNMIPISAGSDLRRRRVEDLGERRHLLPRVPERVIRREIGDARVEAEEEVVLLDHVRDAAQV